MIKKVTLEDIGRKLGVSAVTVSKALKDQKGVSEQLKEEIRRTADEMGYRQRTRAHNMRVSHTIGILIADHFLEEHQSFYWILYQQLAERIMKKGSSPLLEVVSAGTEADNIPPRIIAEQRADGVIIMGTFSRRYMEFLYYAAGRTVPLVCLDSEVGLERDDVIIGDNVGGGYVMTNYLLSLGHKRIGFAGTLLATSSIDDRYLGYVKALLHHGIEVNHAWVINDRDRESGRLLESGQILLPEPDPEKGTPTAWFCNCDLTACSLMEALKLRGLRVPRDVSVVGFDNHLPQGMRNPDVTTYEINAKLMVARAVSRILQKIDMPSSPGGVVVVGGTFIERSSAARAGEPVPYV